MPFSVRLSWVVWAALVAAGCFLLLNHILMRIHLIRKADVDGLKRVRTRNGTMDVSDYIKDLGLERETVPTDLCAIIEQLNEQVDPERLERMYWYSDVDIPSGVYADSWGTPIKLVVKSPRDYALVSFGANMKDDGGEGDDIVYSFNPLEFLEKRAAKERDLKDSDANE